MKESWTLPLNTGNTLKTDADAKFDVAVTCEAADIKPQVTWGNEPLPVLQPMNSSQYQKASQTPPSKSTLLHWHTCGREGATFIRLPPQIKCLLALVLTSSHRYAAAVAVAKGRQVAKHATIVPNFGASKSSRRLALDVIFKEAGFEWRSSLCGCSMCSINEQRPPWSTAMPAASTHQTVTLAVLALRDGRVTQLGPCNEKPRCRYRRSLRQIFVNFN
ncbi:aconitase family protein [Vibrio chagasii]|nr:aconitase family protein [Vibrio chagasii]